MQLFDVAIIGGGPAGSSCGAFCAMAGLQSLVLDREKFPREKVCGDCLNPSCWPVLERLELADRVQDLPHSKLCSVAFIAIDGREVIVDLPSGANCEISVKRSLFDDLLLRRARELGANVHEQTTVTGLSRNDHWNIETASGEFFQARILIGADGRNSTVAHLCNLLPRPARERVALQAHIPLPRDFGNRIVLQFLREGYSGQASVNETQLNLCLVGTPPTISKLRRWAERQFQLPADQGWRTITPLTRSPIPSAHENLFFIGDAARVVEPFTGRRNLLRAALGRAGRKRGRKNCSRRESALSAAEFHSRILRHVSRTFVDQSPRARGGLAAATRLVVCSHCAN